MIKWIGARCTIAENNEAWVCVQRLPGARRATYSVTLSRMYKTDKYFRNVIGKQNAKRRAEAILAAIQGEKQ